MAENGGFEPPIELSPYNGLANRRLQPLGQLSVCVAWAWISVFLSLLYALAEVIITCWPGMETMSGRFVDAGVEVRTDFA
jgi:hypothetical protein